MAERAEHPSIIGIEIGPISAPTQATTIPSTPPRPSAQNAITTLSATNPTVRTRPARSDAASPNPLARRQILGSTSRVTTAEIAVASEAAMAMVCEKTPTSTSPSRPGGRNRNAIPA
ncbi:hypothetical protein GCM10025787_14390 [Saccharopolyspora rosea]